MPVPYCRYPIEDLIEHRLKELGIGRGGLALRCGYRNVSKGVRRIEALCAGDLTSRPSQTILRALPAALELAPDVVFQAIEATEAVLAEEAAEREATWRAAFKPSAWLLGTRKVPTQIWMFALGGGADAFLRIPLDLFMAPETFAEQAHAVVRRTKEARFFGPTTGFINYTPDHDVRFDLDGKAVDSYGRAYSPGRAEVFIGHHRIRGGSMISVNPLSQYSARL